MNSTPTCQASHGALLPPRQTRRPLRQIIPPQMKAHGGAYTPPARSRGGDKAAGDTHGCQGGQRWWCNSPCSGGCCRWRASCTRCGAESVTHQGLAGAQQRGRGQVPSGNQEHWQPSVSVRWWGTGGRSRVGRRAGGGDIVIGGIGNAPEVEVVALLRRSLIPLFLEASELPEQSKHPANQRPFRHRESNASCRLQRQSPTNLRTALFRRYLGS